MSDNTATAKPEKISRNSVELPLSWKEKEKGESKGQIYPTLDMIVYKPGEEEDELGDIDVDKTKDRLINVIIPHLGWDFVAKSLQAKYNLMAQNAMSAAEIKNEKDEGTGQFDWEKLTKFLSELSARTGESIPELEKQLKAYANEMPKLFTKMMDTSLPASEVEAAKQRGLRVSAEITRINSLIESRKRGPRGDKSESTNGENATKEAVAQPA